LLSRRRLLLAACLLAALAAPWRVVAQATGAPPGASALLLRLARVDEGLRVSYSARLELPKTIDEALHKGVPLYFQAELRISRQRWYWRDATVARAERQWRLAFQPLTRQYRVSTGGLHQGFDTLAEALTVIGRAGAWEVALREEAQADAGYEMSFRLRLDTTQLPGPLQIGLGLGAQLEVGQQRPLAPAELMPVPTAKE